MAFKETRLVCFDYVLIIKIVDNMIFLISLALNVKVTYAHYIQTGMKIIKNEFLILLPTIIDKDKPAPKTLVTNQLDYSTFYIISESQILLMVAAAEAL